MMDMNQLIALLRQQQGQGTAPTGGTGQIIQPQRRNLAAPTQGPGPQPGAALMRGIKTYNDAAGNPMGKGLAGLLRGAAGMGSGADIGAAAAQYGPEVAKMGGSVLGGAAGAGQGMAGMVPGLGAAAAGVMAAPGIGQMAGDAMSSLGLDKTGFPDQARAVGQFVGGDFGGAWDSFKDSIKNIFSIF